MSVSHTSKIVITLILLASLLSASVAGVAGSPGEPRMVTYNKLNNLQDWKGALNIIREEIANPILRTDAYQADLRTIAMSALGNYSYFYGNEQALDEEAKRYFEEGIKLAGGDRLRQSQMKKAAYGLEPALWQGEILF